MNAIQEEIVLKMQRKIRRFGVKFSLEETYSFGLWLAKEENVLISLKAGRLSMVIFDFSSFHDIRLSNETFLQLLERFMFHK